MHELVLIGRTRGVAARVLAEGRVGTDDAPFVVLTSRGDVCTHPSLGPGGAAHVLQLLGPPVLVVPQGGGGARRTRPLESVAFAEPGDLAFEFEGLVRPELLVVASSRFDVRTSVAAPKLGTRRTVDVAPARGAFVVQAARGAVVVRVAGEEEPVDLDRGDTLWVRGATRDLEVEVAGAGDDAVAAVVVLAPIER